MLISSMDQLNYYSMPKDSYLEIDTASGGYSMGQPAICEEGSPTYLNEENSPKNGTKSSLYKTELCKRFSEFGSCRYGAKCQFAHGLAELRHVVRHPKYKTTKCKSYWGSGHCPYGSRCRFIHEEAESMTQPPYSPPSVGGGMSGMFFQEKTPEPLSAPASSNYLYSGAHSSSSLGMNVNGDHVLNGNYQNPLMSSFSQDASVPWGSTPSRSQPKLNYGGASSAPPPVIPSATNANGTGYPDLQDAIDALMRFSLTPAEADAQLRAAGAPAVPPTSSGSAAGTAVPSTLGTISTAPVSSAASVEAVSDSRGKKDYSLDSDELWKDFPSLSSSTVSDYGDKQWPAGLSLSLEGTGLFSNTSSASTPSSSTAPTSASTASGDQTESTSTTPKGKKDETSPRLSVFERFH